MPREPLIPEGTCRVINGKRICRKDGKYYQSGTPIKASEASRLVVKKKIPKKPPKKRAIPTRKEEVADCGCDG